MFAYVCFLYSIIALFSFIKDRNYILGKIYNFLCIFFTFYSNPPWTNIQFSHCIPTSILIHIRHTDPQNETHPPILVPQLQ